MSLTNSLVNSVCYPSASIAEDNFYSAIPPVIHVGETDSYQITHVKTSEGWVQLKQQISSSGSFSTVYSTVVTPPTFPPCDATQAFFDGMEIGWGVVAAMAAVTSVILIRKAFFAS
jgi:hypothetical protein